MNTPTRPVNRRVSTLQGNLVVTPLRRSLGPRNAPHSSPLVPADDEEERSRRRSVVAIQNRLSSLGSSSSPGLDCLALNENEIQTHLQMCRKLFNENRISVKNAWQLHVIDVMRKITQMNNADALQIAGYSLDIGAKVYAVRVDDVHAKGLQLANSMVTGDQKRIFQEADGAPADLEQTRVQRRRVVKKRSKRMAADKRNTVDAEGKNLFGSIKHVKSVIFDTKENVDVGATENLFTCKLPEDPSTFQLMQISNEKYWYPKPDAVLNKDLVVNMDLPKIKHFDMCKYFKDFEIGEWNPEEEEAMMRLYSICDENGVPLPDLDGSFHDLLENNEEDAGNEDDQEEVFQAQQMHGELQHIVDAIPEEHRIQNDYGYNSLIATNSGKYLEKLWAGPSHWKVKFNKRSSSRYSGSVVQQVVKSKRKTKVAQPIDFTLPEEDPFAGMKKFPLKKAPKPVNNIDKITSTTHFKSSNYDKAISKYFDKDDLLIKRLNQQPSNEPDDNSGAPFYNYDNPNDSNYCSQNLAGDGDNSCEEELPPASQQRFIGENLVAPPEMVKLLPVKYNLRQKKMDMKKLKATIWKGLRPDKNDKVESILFSEVYNWLPSQLPSDMRKELSFSLAMVALLHLCNEKSLLLASQGLNDFTVRGLQGN